MTLSERARYAIEEAVLLAFEDGGSREEVEAEFEYAIQNAEDDA